MANSNQQQGQKTNTRAQTTPKRQSLIMGGQVPAVLAEKFQRAYDAVGNGERMSADADALYYELMSVPALMRRAVLAQRTPYVVRKSEALVRAWVNGKEFAEPQMRLVWDHIGLSGRVSERRACVVAFSRWLAEAPLSTQDHDRAMVLARLDQRVRERVLATHGGVVE